MKAIEHACSKEILNKNGTMPAKMWTHPHTHTLDKNWIIIVTCWELHESHDVQLDKNKDSGWGSRLSPLPLQWKVDENRAGTHG